MGSNRSTVIVGGALSANTVVTDVVEASSREGSAEIYSNSKGRVSVGSNAKRVSIGGSESIVDLSGMPRYFGVFLSSPRPWRSYEDDA